jgi:hypothetical protein
MTLYVRSQTTPPPSFAERLEAAPLQNSELEAGLSKSRALLGGYQAERCEVPCQ